MVGVRLERTPIQLIDSALVVDGSDDADHEFSAGVTRGLLNNAQVNSTHARPEMLSVKKEFARVATPMPNIKANSIDRQAG